MYHKNKFKAQRFEISGLNGEQQMRRKTRFLPRDWKQLSEATTLIYIALMKGDENDNLITNRHEAKALHDFLSDYEPAAPVVTELIETEISIVDLRWSYDEAMAQLEAIGELIDNKATEDDETAIRGFLIDAAEAIAEASTENSRKIRRDKAVNRDEKQTLRQIEKALNPKNRTLLRGRRKRQRKVKMVKKVVDKLKD